MLSCRIRGCLASKLLYCTRRPRDDAFRFSTVAFQDSDPKSRHRNFRILFPIMRVKVPAGLTPSAIVRHHIESCCARFRECPHAFVRVRLHGVCVRLVLSGKKTTRSKNLHGHIIGRTYSDEWNNEGRNKVVMITNSRV